MPPPALRLSSLTWMTATETNNLGFEIERSINNSEFNKIGFVDGKGTTAEVQRYSFADKIVEGKLGYRLKQIDYDGSHEYSKVVEVDLINVNSFALEQNYPNPFNPKTIINYELPITNHVNLSIYNLIGQKIFTLVSKKQPAGSYKVEWDASNFASGIYVYRLEANGLVMDKKMILLK